MHLVPTTGTQVKGSFLLVWILQLISLNLVCADSGQDFLTSIIARLKEEKPAENYNLFFDELLKATSRSADEYQIHENQPAEPAAAGNELLDFNQNALQQFNQWPNEANFITGNDLNSQLVNFQSFSPANRPPPPVSNSFHNPVIDQPIAFPDFPNFPSQQQQQQQLQQLQQQSLLDPALDSSSSSDFGQQQPLSLHDNRGPNLFSSTEDAFGAQQVATPTYNLQVGQTNGVQPLTLPALMLNQGLNAIRNGPLKLAYNNYYNADHVVNDHLIDNALNAVGPGAGEHLIAGPHKQFMVEPLFVAMAGFVGIAMIFMSAVLFLPKLLTPPPQVSSLKGPQEIAALTKLAVQTIEGNDCTERIACEVGRAMRSLHVSGKPIEVLEVLVSKNVASQLAQIRKAITKKQVCRLIQCKPLKSIGYSAADKSKSAVEPKLPKIEYESQSLWSLSSSSTALKSDKAKENKHQSKEKQSPPEPRIETTSKHSVVKKTLKAEQPKEPTTKRSPTTVILKLL